MFRIKRKSLLLLVFLLVFSFSVAYAELRISFLNVGQGDAIVVQCSDETVLIDAGPVDAGATVNKYLRDNLGLEDLKAVFVTHNHDDHIGGMLFALEGLRVQTIYTSPTLPVLYWFNTIRPILRQSDLDTVTPSRGDTIMVGDALITCLNIDDSSLSVNNRSTVLRVDYGNTSFLLMGDAEADEELELLSSGVDLHADVIKIGHHGGLGSTSSDLLKAVMPEYAIISVAAVNDFGHPAAETLTMLEKYGIKVCRTDLRGSVICISDGEKISIVVQK